MSSLEIEALLLPDVPLNVALSRSVGWKDVESEWRVLHAAGSVRGVRRDGAVVAQGVLGDYGSCASLAKMVVAKELQGQRLGARLLDGFLQQASARGIPVGLVATEQGRPLYASRGFQVSAELMILFGVPQLGTAAPSSSVTSLLVDEAVDIDARFSGCDRSRMLRARWAEASVKLRLQTEAGFALATDQGDHTLVGPILAESEAGARALFGAVVEQARGPLRLDVPLEHAGFRQWLVSSGMAEMSQRVEMAYAAARLPWQAPQRFALSTQAWG
jgi:GNAT superfamily N-acetyltransferase